MIKNVIDENVLVVANGRSTVTLECQLASLELLEQCSVNAALVLDEMGEILAAYSNHCDWSGQPGVGDQFFVWLQQNRHRHRTVALASSEQRRYVDFPEDEELSGFDWDDRVYVATAIVAGARVVNAADSDYSHYADAFVRCGVTIYELCSAELKPKPQRGSGQGRLTESTRKGRRTQGPH